MDARRIDREREREVFQSPLYGGGGGTTGLDKDKGGAQLSVGGGVRDHANISPYSDTWEYLEDGDFDGDGDEGAYIDEACSDEGEGGGEYNAYDPHGTSSMKTLILESRLGEDFLSLFAPHPDT